MALCAKRPWIYPKFNILKKTAVSPDINELVYLCPNPWYNNSKATLFSGIPFFEFSFSFLFTKNECVLCALCGIVTKIFFLSLKYTLQNYLWNTQVCPKFIEVTTKNNLCHRSGAKSTLCNVAMKGYLLLSLIVMWIFPFCFTVM